MLQQRQTAENPVDPENKHQRVNLLNWDGKGAPAGLFPERKDQGRAGAGQHEPARRLG